MSHVANVMVSIDPTDLAVVEMLDEWLQTAATRRGFGPSATGYVGSLIETTGSNTLWGGGKYPECEVYAGALNHLDLGGLVAYVERLPWTHPEFVQVFVMDQEEAYFRVWMFRGPKLRQIAPIGREDDVWTLTPARDVHTRFALASDADLLRDALVAAVNGTPTSALPPDAVLADPRHARYVDGWPRDTDLGVVAVATREADQWQPEPVGAAWLRYFTVREPGYGFVADDVPELSIAVPAQSERGNGIGTLLIRRLMALAAETGVERVALSVARDNPAVRLYEREGFRPHEPRTCGGSLTMVVQVLPTA